MHPNIDIFTEYDATTHIHKISCAPTHVLFFLNRPVGSPGQDMPREEVRGHTSRERSPPECPQTVLEWHYRVEGVDGGGKQPDPHGGAGHLQSSRCWVFVGLFVRRLFFVFRMSSSYFQGTQHNASFSTQKHAGGGKHGVLGSKTSEICECT